MQFATRCAVVLVTMAFGVNCQADTPTLSEKTWSDDIAQLTEAIKTTHFKPFHEVDEADFDSAIAQLQSRLASLSDREIVIELARIVARFKDGHTRVHLPRRYPEFALEAELGHSGTPAPKTESLKLGQLPLRFELFDDGLYVIAAIEEHANLIGNRVVAFDDTAVDVAIENVRAVSFFENDSRAKLMAPDRLALPDVLVSLGTTATRERTALTSETATGERTVSQLETLDAAGVRFVPDDSQELPPWLQRFADDRWYEIVDDAIYVQVNRFEEDPPVPYGDFVAETLVAARDAGVSRYIVDLRNNSGGIGAWTTPFVWGLVGSEFNEYGRLFVLTGRTTFSAAQMLLHQFEELTYAAFVGEPSGAKPSHFGDAQRIVLDNSGVTLRVSTIYWHSWLANDFRDEINPHIPVALQAADYFDGNDAVLQAALDYVAPATLAEQMAEQFRLGNNQNGLLLYQRFLSDATIDNHRTAIPGLLSTADQLADDGIVRPAYFVYFLANMTYPGDAAVEEGMRRLQALLEQ